MTVVALLITKKMIWFSFFKLVLTLLMARNCYASTTADFFYSYSKSEESSEVKFNSTSNAGVIVNSHSMPSQHRVSAESKVTEIEFETKDVEKKFSFDRKENIKDKTEVESGGSVKKLDNDKHRDSSSVEKTDHDPKESMKKITVGGYHRSLEKKIEDDSKEMAKEITDDNNNNSMEGTEDDSKELRSKIREDNYEKSRVKSKDLRSKTSDDNYEKIRVKSKEFVRKFAHDKFNDSKEKTEVNSEENSKEEVEVQSKEIVKKISHDKSRPDSKTDSEDDPKDVAKKTRVDSNEEDLDSPRKKLHWFKTERQKQVRAKNKTLSSSNETEKSNQTLSNSNDTLPRAVVNSHSIPSLHIIKQRPYNDKIDDIYSWVIINSHTFRKPQNAKPNEEQPRQRDHAKSVPREASRTKAKVSDKEDHHLRLESKRKTPPRRHGYKGGLRGLIMPVVKSLQVLVSLLF
jgi:hypothetical protein